MSTSSSEFHAFHAEASDVQPETLQAIRDQFYELTTYVPTESLTYNRSIQILSGEGVVPITISINEKLDTAHTRSILLKIPFENIEGGFSTASIDMRRNNETGRIEPLSRTSMPPELIGRIDTAALRSDTPSGIAGFLAIASRLSAAPIGEPYSEPITTEDFDRLWDTAAQELDDARMPVNYLYEYSATLGGKQVMVSTVDRVPGWGETDTTSSCKQQIVVPDNFTYTRRPVKDGEELIFKDVAREAAIRESLPISTEEERHGSPYIIVPPTEEMITSGNADYTVATVELNERTADTFIDETDFPTFEAAVSYIDKLLRREKARKIVGRDLTEDRAQHVLVVLQEIVRGAANAAVQSGPSD